MKPEHKNLISELYAQMYAMLFEYARSCLDTDSLAEEAVQQTFVIACDKPESLASSPNPRGWLVNTLKHVISNTRRTLDTANRILADYCALNKETLTVTHDSAKLELEYGALAHTEEFYLVKSIAVDGRSYLEMSQELGISMDACRKRFERARKILQKNLK